MACEDGCKRKNKQYECGDCSEAHAEAHDDTTILGHGIKDLRTVISEDRKQGVIIDVATGQVLTIFPKSSK